MTEMSVTVISVKTRAVIVPMARPLVTAGGAVDKAPLVLIDLQTSSGAVGRAYIFAYHPWALEPLVRMVDALGENLVGAPFDPPAMHQNLLATLRLLGWQGIAGMAVSGLDMAAWDAFGKEQGKPLYQILGGTDVPIPAYNSKGLGMVGPDRVGQEAQELLAEGFAAIKVRLGYATPEEDLAVVRAVKAAVPVGTPIMSDYNQSQSVESASERIELLDAEGLAWVEEPVRFDDFTSHAAVREAARTPIQTGENCWFPGDMEKCLVAGASDLFMPDAGKIGGVTGWLEAARLGQKYNVPLSSHLYPEISVHLLAATPTRHWLEYVDWATPILAEPLAVTDDACRPPNKPGIGIDWDGDAIDIYAV